MNQLTTLYNFTLASLERLMADVGDDQMAHQPAGGWGRSGAEPPANHQGRVHLLNAGGCA